MSNFTFLKTDWPELYETAREAGKNVVRLRSAQVRLATGFIPGYIVPESIISD